MKYTGENKKLQVMIESWRIRSHQKELVLGIKLTIYIMLILLPLSSNASVTCGGRFVNPLTDICWSCILPISIGSFNIGKGNVPKERDTRNPRSPICMCTKNSVPVPGLSIGFWEPVRLVEVTRTPYCLVNLGGLEIGRDNKKISSYERRNLALGRRSHNSFYHLHYYIYPLIYWLELITDFMCLEQSSFEVGYMSEFDITWNDEKLQTLLNPEAILFANPIAQIACSADCIASSLDLPLDNMFWCAGCLGNLYPLSGANADHQGGVQNSSLLIMRILAKMHKIGLGMETSTSDGSVNGAICRKRRIFKLKKSQYKLQMVNPKSSSKGIGCWPIGLSDLLYSKFCEYPGDGQDWGYVIWRKKNCCFM